MQSTINIQTQNSQDLILVTQQIQETVAASGIRDGICYLFCPHTTAAITVNSYLDPATALDLREEIDRLVPIRANFHHVVDTPPDAAAHIKVSLIGGQVFLIIRDGHLTLGDSQGIFFWEFDGPRSRQILVKLMEG